MEEEQFGKEWRTEAMRNTKETLVDMIVSKEKENADLCESIQLNYDGSRLWHKKWKEMIEENEELKKEIRKHVDYNNALSHDLSHDIIKLKKENEELKNRIKTAYENGYSEGLEVSQGSQEDI